MEIQNYLVILAAGLGIFNLFFAILFFRQWRTYKRRQDMLLSGEKATNLEEIIVKNKTNISLHASAIKHLSSALEDLDQRNLSNLQHVGLVRFNPFSDAGGNISFSLALLDGNNDGLIVSSLHGRNGTRIYTKPVSGGRSANPLTEEEQQAITQATGKKK